MSVLQSFLFNNKNIFYIFFGLFISISVNAEDTNSLLKEFEKNPSQETADPLIELMLSSHQNQAQEIMRHLIKPSFVVREKYSAGEKVYFGLERPCTLQIPLGNDSIVKRGYFVNDDPEGEGWSSGVFVEEGKINEFEEYKDSLNYREFSKYEWRKVEDRYQESLNFDKPGVYTITGHELYNYIVPLTEKVWRWSSVRYIPFLSIPQRWNRYKLSNDRIVKFEFREELNINVVPADKVEPIKMISNSELDRKMQNAFTFELMTNCSSTVESGEIHNCLKIQYKKLPINVGLEAYYVQSGQIYPCEDFLWHEHQEESGFIIFSANNLKFPFEKFEFGQHSGTIVLTPSTKAAIRHPAIHEIWDGTLEFPFTFIKEKKQ